VGAKAVLHKNEGAQFLAIGIGLTFLSAFYDFLIENGILHSPQLSNIGILVCTFLISALISWRFSKSFSAVKSLSEELTQANIELSGMDKPDPYFTVLRKGFIPFLSVFGFLTNRMTVSGPTFT
jgi:hypothetical protein